MKKYIIIIVFFSTVFTSCKPLGFNSVLGDYRTKGGFEWGSRIVLNQDSTFRYNEWIGGYSGAIIGTWRIDGKYIILNSSMQPKPDTTKEYYIIKSHNDNSNNMTFDLTDGLETIPGVTGLLFQNGDTIENKFSDINGRLVFQNQIADSIKISFIGLKDVVLKNNSNNYYQIKMVDNYTNKYEFFTNATLKIRGNNLIDKTKHSHYYEKRFYRIE